MARLSLEDFDGIINAIVFPKVYEKKRNLVRNDQIVGVSGRVSFKDENDAEILVEDIVPIEDISMLARGRRGERPVYNGYGGYESRQAQAAPQPVRQKESAPPDDPVKLRITEEVLKRHRDARGMLYHLTDMMSLYPGSRDVLVYLPGQKPVRCSKSSRVTFTGELRAKLERLLGEENVKG